MNLQKGLGPQIANPQICQSEKRLCLQIGNMLNATFAGGRRI
jgi:hypothetical protein